MDQAGKLNSARRLRGFRFAILAAVVLPVASGCGWGDDSAKMISRQDQLDAQKSVSDVLKDAGAKIDFDKQYQAWTVDFSGGKVTDDLLGRLKELDRIKEVNFSGTAVTDQQLSLLKDAKTVVIIDVSDTGVSDAGLMNLSDLVLLSQVKAQGSKITTQGIEEFQKKRATKEMMEARRQVARNYSIPLPPQTVIQLN